MPDISSAITGGLIGSVVTAFLSYHVQDKLAHKRRQEDEERLAYVYLVRITDLIVAETLLRNVSKILWDTYSPLLGEKAAKFNPPGKEFDLSHSIPAAIEIALKEAKAGTMTDLGPLANGVIESIENKLNFNVPPELLTKLPREVIQAYTDFAEYALYTSGTLKVIFDAIGKRDFHIVTANLLHSGFNSAKLMIERAKEVRTGLLAKGAVSKSDADALFSRLFKRQHSVMMANINNNDKLKAALVAIAALAEKPKDSPTPA